ncbi:MAG: DUF4160 domain-containing protein [Nitrospira sp.]|jgi:hypothetical protein|nr:DUF4160 domain-containing protein [Nitrospira sp.]MBX3338476.1 DUF4160 domain-containing protein [Nitrospira sp.]MCC7472425.1 DUF4160 domain-containing protein [Candidatus Nomurabacteria bacterium]
MPELCRFFGIIITMYYDDHAPPHFHVRYSDYKAIMGIDSLMLLDGYLPPRALGLVAEWGALHRDELREDWSLAEQRAPLKKIRPLEYASCSKILSKPQHLTGIGYGCGSKMALRAS